MCHHVPPLLPVCVYVCDVQKRRLFSMHVSLGRAQTWWRVRGDAVVFTSLWMDGNGEVFLTCRRARALLVHKVLGVGVMKQGHAY